MQTYGSQWQSHAARVVQRIFYYKSHENHISTASNVKTHISPTSHTCCIYMYNQSQKFLYDKIIITIVPSYTRKNITHLLPFVLLWVCSSYCYLRCTLVTTQMATNSWSSLWSYIMILDIIITVTFPHFVFLCQFARCVLVLVTFPIGECIIWECKVWSNALVLFAEEGLFGN